MPAIASDSFTGAAGTSLHARATSGGTWQTAGGSSSARLSALNSLACTSGTGVASRIDVGVADHYSRLTALVLGALQTASPTVRAVSAINFIALRAVSATTVEIFKRVGSATETIVASIGGLSIAAPVTLELRVAGSTVTAYVNGQQVGAAGGYTVADAGLQTSTLAGVWLRGALDPIADDWEAGTPDAAAPTLASASGRHAQRATPGALATAVTLSPARARQAQRAGSAALATGAALVPARGRQVQRAGAAALSVPGGLVPARGRQLQRAGAGAVAIGFALAVRGARQAQRAGAASLATAAGRIAIETTVPAETRVERATRP